MKKLIFCFIILPMLTMFQPANAADKLTVLLDWYVNPDHAPLFVADAQGFFAQQGLDVELIAPANPNDPPKLVAAKKADIAISYQPQLHLQVDAGIATCQNRHIGCNSPQLSGCIGEF